MASSSRRLVAMAVLGTVFIGVLASVALGAQASWNARAKKTGQGSQGRILAIGTPRGLSSVAT